MVTRGDPSIVIEKPGFLTPPSIPLLATRAINTTSGRSATLVSALVDSQVKSFVLAG